MLRRKLLVAAVVLMFCCPFIDGNVWLFALQQPRQAPIAQRTETTAKPKSEIDQPNAVELSKEIRQLTKEIRKLGAQQRRITDLLFYKIEQERSDKIKDKLAAIEAQLNILTSRQSQLDFRLKNIDNELLTRTFLNRSDGEKAIRKEVEDEKDRIKTEQSRLEVEKQKILDEIRVSDIQIELIRTRLLSGTVVKSDDDSSLTDYFYQPTQTDKQELDTESTEKNKN
jgi:seryl-tRNA synthetase